MQSVILPHVADGHKFQRTVGHVFLTHLGFWEGKPQGGVLGTAPQCYRMNQGRIHVHIYIYVYAHLHGYGDKDLEINMDMRRPLEAKDHCRLLTLSSKKRGVDLGNPTYHMPASISVYGWTHVYIYIHIDMCRSTLIPINTYMNNHTHIYLCICIYVYIYIHLYQYFFVFEHIPAHICDRPHYTRRLHWIIPAYHGGGVENPSETQRVPKAKFQKSHRPTVQKSQSPKVKMSKSPKVQKCQIETFGLLNSSGTFECRMCVFCALACV